MTDLEKIISYFKQIFKKYQELPEMSRQSVIIWWRLQKNVILKVIQDEYNNVIIKKRVSGGRA